MRPDIASIKAGQSLPDWIARLTNQEIVNRKIRCPFHVDTNPSLHVYDDGHWYCFSCARHGDVLDFVGYFLRGDQYDPHTHIVDVIDYIASLGVRSDVTPAATPAAKPPPTRLDPRLASRYHHSMNEYARDWWHSRGLSDETIDTFRLGYDGKRFTIPAFYRGVLLGINRRRDDSLTLEGPKYMRLKGSRISLFNADLLLGKTDYVIICEGEIDAMMLYQHGWLAVSSTGGCATFRPAWARYFAHVKDVFVMMDNDEPGMQGALKVRSMIRRAHIIMLPDGYKDVSDVFMNAGGDVIGGLIQEASNKRRP